MSKSRNEKKSPAQPIVPPVTTNEIIPGKFNENQWNFMLEQENAQEFILEILDNILDCTVRVIREKYIQSQLQPYSVQAAKDLLLEIIETRFLDHDLGEKCSATDFTWLEDEEPIPCVTDSWAQGSVPVYRHESRPSTSRSESKTRGYSASPDKFQRNGDDHEVKTEDEKSIEQAESSQVGENEMSMICIPSPPPTSRVASPGRRKNSVKATAKRTKLSNKNKPTVEVVEENKNKFEEIDVLPCQMKPAKQAHLMGAINRASGEQEVTYDEKGNIVAMMRISVDKLPTHRIRPRYGILDAQTEYTSSTRARKVTKKDETLSRTPQGYSLLTDAKRTKNALTSSLKSSFSSETLQNENDEMIKPLPPPLADSMDISPGVVIKEGPLVRKGADVFSASRPTAQANVVNLQPVGSLAKRQTISVSDVIGSTSPVIKQMRLPEPIPPIAHRS